MRFCNIALIFHDDCAKRDNGQGTDPKIQNSDASFCRHNSLVSSTTILSVEQIIATSIPSILFTCLFVVQFPRNATLLLSSTNLACARKASCCTITRRKNSACTLPTSTLTIPHSTYYRSLPENSISFEKRYVLYVRL